jgi:ATP-binding cassette subfamily B protein
MLVTGRSLTGLLRRLWQQTSPKRRLQAGILFALMVATSLAEVASIGMVVPFLGVLVSPERVYEHAFAQTYIEGLGLHQPRDLILPITVLFFVIALLAAAMRITLLWVQIRFSAALATEFSTKTYQRTLYQPYAFHISQNSSEILAGVSKAGELGNMLITPSLVFLSSTFFLCMILSALMAIDPLVALSALFGFASIYTVIAVLTKRRLERDSRKMSVESGRMIQALQEGLGGIRDVLIEGTQATFTDIYRSASAPFRSAVASINIVSQSPRILVEVLGMLLIAAIAYVLSTADEGLQHAIPVLGALAMGAQRLLPALQQAYASITALRGNRDSIESALSLLERPMPVAVSFESIKPLPFRQGITLDGLSFRYAPDGPWVLKNIGLIIPKGSKFGFIGATGSGKSTLLDIVMGLLPPSQGKLLIDGQAVSPHTLRAWQVHVAHVPQAIYLADATIAENIAFGVPKDKIDFERVKQAARQAQIADTIEGWVQEYQTIVGERGVRLSGGQRQRIGIARALYKQADVIIFDEATSALDNETELEVMQAIESLGDNVTILIIAHRLTTLRMCSRVVELAQGSIQRIGSYADILH